MRHIISAALLLLSFSAFGQYGLGNPNRTMQILGYQTSARGIIHYASGLPNTVITWRTTKDTAAYYWVDTLTSRMYNWHHTGNYWQTLGVIEAASAPAATQANGPATIDNRNTFWRSTSNNDFHYYDRDLSSWVAFGAGGGGGADNWGTQVVQHDATLTGTGVVGSALGIAQQSATSGQVLKWNGSAWSPAADAGTTYTGGTGINVTGTVITNTAPDQTVTITGAGINSVTGTYPNFTVTGTEVDGSISNEGSLTVGAGTGTTSIINSNTSSSTGVTITAATGLAISEAGNVITLTNTSPDQTVSLSGTGITVGGTYPSFTLTAADQSATNELQTISTGTNTLTLSNSGGTVTVDTDPTDDLAKTLTSAQVFVGNGSNVATGVAVSGDATITNAGVVTVDKIDNKQVVATGAADGQVLKWSVANNQWEPANDVGGGSGDNWGSQVVVHGSTITGNGTSGTPLDVATDGITATQIAADAVGSSEIATDAVGSAEIAAGAVGTSEIADGAVVYGDIQNISATDKVLGRSTAGAGSIEEIACTAAGRALIDDADATAQRTTLGLGSIATQAASSVTITGGSITGITDLAVADGGTGSGTASGARSNLGAAASGANTDITSVYLNNTGLKVKDTDATHGISIVPGSNLTTDHTLTLVTGDADRTITLSGNTTLSGTNTGDQTITLTGDVTGSGTGSFVATIANDAVTYAKMQNVSATDRLLGRDAVGAGDAEELTVGGGIEFTGTGGIQTSALTGDVTKTAGGTVTAIANNAVTSAKIATDAVGSAQIAADAVGSSELASTAVTPGSYTLANITVDADGRITAAANGTGGGGGDALTSSPLSQFAATTSAQLAGVISDETGSGALVFGTSPTLTSPNLGTPTAINLSNATALPLTSGVSGILPAANGGTGNGFFSVSGPATTTKTFTLPNASATILTDNAAVTVAQGGTGRTTSTTAYGLIAAGTTATGALQTLPAGATTDILVGGGAAALPAWTTATGSGAPVRATSPTLTTPTLGVATATSINKVAITAPATGATLTIADGATLTASANATVSGTNTGDQTITLTGDVTGSGTGSFAATIATDAVTAAKIATDAVGSSEIAADAVGPSELAATTVTAGSYTSANITVDADGRITAASNGSGGSAGYATIEEEGTGLTQRTNLNFVGSALTAADATTKTTVTVDGDVNAIADQTGTGLAARTATDAWTTRTITGTANRLSVTNGGGVAGNPTLDIDAAYVGQSSITTLGTITTGTWTGTTVAVANGGTGATTATAAFNGLSPSTTLGDVIYHNGTNDVRLAGNTTTAKQYLSQTGNGSVSAAPAWGAIAEADITDGSILARVGGNETITGAWQFPDNGFTVADNADATKKVVLEASGITTATTRTLTVPNASGTIALTSNLGTIASQNAASVSITGGSITGITDLAVEDGGTGASSAATARSNLGAAASGANTDITSVVLNNTGLAIKDSDASHNLTITTGSNITAARTLTINPGDASRTLTLGGDATINGGTHSGTNTGDQTITLTGDVTGSGTGSFAATIANGAVTNAKAANMANGTIKGRTTAGTGAPEDLTAAQAAAIIQGSVDHGSISGLADDDHTQYALLAGRSGGQTLTGGTAASNSLTLRSTSNATKGDILIADQGGNAVFGGGTTASELRILEASGSGTNYTALKAQAQAGNVTYTLPAADGSTGQVLSTNGSGTLAWATASGGGGSPSVISPSQITANQNDYSPTGWADATLVRLDGDTGFRMITGFSAETSGEEKTLLNIGSNPIYLAPEHTGSSAANRIAFYREVIIPPNSSVRITYDGTSSRWRPIESPFFYNIPRSLYYDIDAGKSPTGTQENEYVGQVSSGNWSSVSPASGRALASWGLDNAAGATTGCGVYMLKTQTNFGLFGSQHLVSYAHVQTPTALSTSAQRYYLRLGLMASSASGLYNSNNSCGIRYRDDVNTGKWECYCRDNAGTETTADSGVTVATSTPYELMISVDKALSVATFWINNSVVARITTNLPASGQGAGMQYHFEKSVGTTTITAYVFRIIGGAFGI